MKPSSRLATSLLLSTSFLLLTATAKADDTDDAASRATALTTDTTDAPAAAAHSPSSAPEPAAAPARQESRWYGYQTLASDGASIGLILIGSGVADGRFARDGLTGAGLAGYAVAPSVIHIAHGHVGKGFGALALRVVTPVLAAGIGALIGVATYTPPSTTPNNLGEAIAEPIVGPMARMYVGAEVGFVTGAVVAIAIDAGLLAHEDAKATTPSEKAPTAATAKKVTGRTSAVTLTPSIAPTKNGVSAGLSGTF